MNTVAKINVGRLINKGSYGLGTAALKSRMTYTLYCGASDMIKPLGDLVVPGYRYKFTRHCLSLKNPDASIRTEAVKALVEIKSKEALPYIIPKLDDPDEGVQQEAVIAFGKLEDNQSKRIGKLLELFVDANNKSTVSKIACRILLESLSPEAIRSKVRVYLDEKANRCDTYRWFKLGFERHAENILKELCRSTGPNVS